MPVCFHKIGLMVCALFLLQSCIKNVDSLNYPNGSTPKLVVVSIISPEQPFIKVSVNKTAPYFSNKDASFLVSNALVTLSDGIKTVELQFLRQNFDPRVSFDRSYYYIDSASFKILAGRTYFLEVHTPDGLNARAHCTLPSAMKNGSAISTDTFHQGNIETRSVNIKWEVGPENVIYFFEADVNRLRYNGKDSLKNKIRYSYGSIIHPDQQGMPFNARFFTFKNSNTDAFESQEISAVYFKLYENNLYQLYLSNQSNNYIYYNYNNPPGNNFYFNEQLVRNLTNEFILPSIGLAPGSATVLSGSNVLVEGMDYSINYTLGTLKIINQEVLNSGQHISIKFEGNYYSPPFDASNFVNSDSTAIPFEENLFSEPTHYFSNVEGGFGIFGAYNISIVNIK